VILADFCDQEKTGTGAFVSIVFAQVNECFGDAVSRLTTLDVLCKYFPSGQKCFF